MFLCLVTDDGYTYLSNYLSIYQFVDLPIYCRRDVMFLCLVTDDGYTYLSNYLSIFLLLEERDVPSIYLFIYLSICLSIYLC